MALNITRSEAAHRADILTVESYVVDLDLRDVTSAPTFPTTTTVRFTSTSPGAPTWIDLVAEDVLGVELNGRPIDVQGYDGARIELPGVASRNVLVVRALGRYMTTGEGLHRLVDPADGKTYVYTQFAAADARRVFACFEQPDLKAPISWRITAPQHWTVRANTSVAPPPADGPGPVRWEFPATRPLSTYLAAVCAGPFHVVESQYEGLHGTYPMALLVRASAAGYLDADEILEVTRAGLAHFEAEFGVPYPFGKYDQVALPEFNLGAMEHPGLVTFQEDLLVFRSRVGAEAHERRAIIILHEMAHMWFGNLVTMRWWDDLWLNESFAEWAGFDACVRVTRHRHAWAGFALSRKVWAYHDDQMPSTHPVAGDVPDLEAAAASFDGITYAKGASVLKQLVAHLGRESFLAGLNRYFTRHAWGNATLADLLVELEAASGRDLGAWATAWLQSPGVTTLAPAVALDAGGRYAHVAVEQLPATRPEGVPDVLRPHRVALGLYRRVAGPDAGGAGGAGRDLARVDRIELDVPGRSGHVPDLAGAPAADLLLVNDDDLTYAKVRFDPGSLRVALSSVGDLPDPLARSVAWGGLWELVRDRLLPAQQFVAATVAGLRTEVDPQVVEVVARLARTAVTDLVAEELAGGLAEQMCAATAELLEGAEPGSDLQLALARAHAASAVDPARVARLEDLLAGRAGITGLELDAELRWAIISRLALLGVVDVDLIDQELAGDRTSAGQRWAAAARAAIPTAEAKAQAWDALMDAAGMANAVLRATVQGFAAPGTPGELLAAYRDRYVDQIADVWAQRPPAEARTLAAGLFPGIDPRSIAAADTMLARDDLPAGLARIVADRRADRLLALECRVVSREQR